MRVVISVSVDFADVGSLDEAYEAIGSMTGWVESNYDCATDVDTILEETASE